MLLFNGYLGLSAYSVGICLVILGIGIAGYRLCKLNEITLTGLSSEIATHFPSNRFDGVQPASAVQAALTISENGYFWFNIREFLVSFTFYGFIVLTAVAIWRFGKAMLDQSERLYEKRHAMRQGRLFVHLKDGILTADDLVKAFSWNVTQPNAFSEMPTDAKAPIGAAVADVANSLKSTADALKSVSEAARAAKSHQ